MSGVTIGLLMGGLVLVLLVIRVHIAVAMLPARGLGYALVAGIDPPSHHCPLYTSPAAAD